MHPCFNHSHYSFFVELVEVESTVFAVQMQRFIHLSYSPIFNQKKNLEIYQGFFVFFNINFYINIISFSLTLKNIILPTGLPIGLATCTIFKVNFFIVYFSLFYFITKIIKSLFFHCLFYIFIKKCHIFLFLLIFFSLKHILIFQ